MNEKREDVSIQATMLVAMPMALLLFISIGMFGPCATAAALLCAVSCLHLQAAHVATCFFFVLCDSRRYGVRPLVFRRNG